MIPQRIDFAGVEFVSPNGWPKLTARQFADLEAAMILKASGQDNAVKAVVLDLEDRIGTRPAHRRAATVGEPLAVTIRTTNRRRQKAERAHVHALLAPWRVARYDHKALAKALRKLESDDPKQKAEAKADLLKLEQATAQVREAARISAERAEIIRCAEARGEDVEAETSDARGHKGRLRYVDRDGLLSLFNSGQISDRQYAAGMRYRELYEKVDPEASLKPLNPARIYSPRHGGEGYAQEQFKHWTELLKLEALVREDDRNGHAVQMLQAFAGNRTSTRRLGRTKDIREDLIAALRVALDRCAGHFGVK